MTTIEQHSLVGVDASGSLCACGVRGDFLEHLADVRLVRALAWIAYRQEAIR